MCWGGMQCVESGKKPCRQMRRLLLQCVSVCCSVLQCVALYCSGSQCVDMSTTNQTARVMCCSALQCVAACCSVL